MDFLFISIKLTVKEKRMPLCEIHISSRVEECVAKWLTPRTLDLEVQVSSLAHRVVSLDKELSSPRCINGYLRYTAGGNPAMD